MTEKEKAFEAKSLYNRGIITRDEAKKMIAPYAQLFNATAKRLAEKYGRKPQHFCLASFLR